MLLSIAVPWYKSPESVIPLYEECLKAFDAMSDFCEIEFVFVEDCGEDDTWQRISALAQTDARVKAAKLSRNFGQHNALTACLDLVNGDWVVLMDNDLQDRPEEIPNLWRKAQEGYDIVLARRGKRKDPIMKRITSHWFMYIFNWLASTDHDGQVGNFRIMSRAVVESFKEMRESVRNVSLQLAWLGFTVGYVDVCHGERYSGRSSYTWKKLISFAIDSIVAFSDKPLRLSINIGLCIITISCFMAIYILFRKLFFGIPVPGWGSIMVSLWFLGGAIIANLGLIGFYLGKIYAEVKNRPLYVIDKTINL